MSDTPAPSTNYLETLPRTPASDMKKLGWRGVMDTVRREGPVLITNHERPEAVIVPVEEYERLQHDAAARNEAVVETLRREYDERLAWLNEPGAHEIIDKLFDTPTDLGGKIFTGREF